MIQDFNIFDEYKIPDVSLCYPNRTKIGDLGRIINFVIDIKFNTYSEISIEVPYEADGILTPHYDKLVSRNKIHVENYGYFIIQDVVETGDGVSRKKSIPAYSEESFLNNRSVNFLEGTYKFYDEDPEIETIMSKIMGYIPNWTLISVSASLWTKYRTFDNTNTTLYSFMMTDVSKAYECFFIFDSENRYVYVKDTDDVVNEVPIYLSYDNLMKTLSITEKTDEYVTALAVTGGGDLDIHTVNPLGTNFIYDFSYPISQNQMTSELATAVGVWVAKIASYQSSYATNLTDYKTANENIITYTSDLTDLQANRLAVEVVMQTKIEDGETDLTTYTAQIALIDIDIAAKQADIDAQEVIRDAKYAALLVINNELDIESNFTSIQYNELLDYVIESSYQNENLIQTSTMTNAEIQEQAQELYDQGVNVLAKISQPRFEFTLDAVNFVFLKEYLQVTNLLQIGSVITVELDETRTATPIVLEIKFNFYNPNEFSLTFGNRYRLDDSAYEFAELIQQTINKGSNIAVDSSLWTDWSNNYQSTVSSFVTSALDASKNRLISATNQQIIIDESGLKGKQELAGGGYSPNQVWLTGNTLAFTDDSWDTVRVALGKITLPDTSTTYGLVADAIVTGTLYASLITILGDTNFYWNSDNIVIENPSDANKIIKIGKYDGTNYGMGFTIDGGSNWISYIGFNDVAFQTNSFLIKNSAGDAVLNIDGSGNLDVTAKGDISFQTDNFSVQDSDGNDMLQIQSTESDTTLVLGSENREVEFGGNFILGIANGGWGRTVLPIHWGSVTPDSGLGEDGDLYVMYNASTSDSWSDTTLSDPAATAGMQTYFGVYRNWNVVYTANDIWRFGNGVGDSSYDRGTYFSFTAPANISSLTFTFYTSKYVPGITLSSGIHTYVVALGSALTSSPITTSTCQATTVPQAPTQQTVTLTTSSPLTSGNTYYIGLYYADTTEGNSAALWSTTTYPIVLVGSTASGSSFGIYVKSNSTWEAI